VIKKKKKAPLKMSKKLILWTQRDNKVTSLIPVDAAGDTAYDVNANMVIEWRTEGRVVLRGLLGGKMCAARSFFFEGVIDATLLTSPENGDDNDDDDDYGDDDYGDDDDDFASSDKVPLIDENKESECQLFMVTIMDKSEHAMWPYFLRNNNYQLRELAQEPFDKQVKALKTIVTRDRMRELAALGPLPEDMIGKKVRVYLHRPNASRAKLVDVHFYDRIGRRLASLSDGSTVTLHVPLGEMIYTRLGANPTNQSRFPVQAVYRSSARAPAIVEVDHFYAIANVIVPAVVRGEVVQMCASKFVGNPLWNGGACPCTCTIL
jgi:hypothetical protein